MSSIINRKIQKMKEKKIMLKIQKWTKNNTMLKIQKWTINNTMFSIPRLDIGMTHMTSRYRHDTYDQSLLSFSIQRLDIGMTHMTGRYCRFYHSSMTGCNPLLSVRPMNLIHHSVRRMKMSSLCLGTPNATLLTR